jgi:hypothetical protein
VATQRAGVEADEKRSGPASDSEAARMTTEGERAQRL